MPSSLAAYIIINCAMLIPTIVGLTHVVDPMAAHYRAGLIPFVALNFGVLSWLATGSRAAIVFEIGRLALWAVTVPLTTDRIGLTHSTGLEVGAALAVLLALHLAITTYANRRIPKMMLSRETDVGRTGKVDVHRHKGWRV